MVHRRYAKPQKALRKTMTRERVKKWSPTGWYTATTAVDGC